MRVKIRKINKKKIVKKKLKIKLKEPKNKILLTKPLEEAAKLKENKSEINFEYSKKKKIYRDPVKKAISDAVGLCNFFTKSYFDLGEWMLIYSKTPMNDYLAPDYVGASKKGATRKKLQKRYYFVK